MWDFISFRKRDPIWIRDGLILGSLILSTDGSFQPHKGTTICAAGWTITCTRIQHLLKGSNLQTIGRCKLLQGGATWYSGYSHSNTSHMPVLQLGFGQGEDML
jgi:hypothetical protein